MLGWLIRLLLTFATCHEILELLSVSITVLLVEQAKRNVLGLILEEVDFVLFVLGGCFSFVLLRLLVGLLLQLAFLRSLLLLGVLVL